MAVQKNGGCTCNRVYLCLRMSQQTNDEWNARAHVCLCPGNHMTCRSCNHQVCAAARVPRRVLAADFGLSKCHRNCCRIQFRNAVLLVMPTRLHQRPFPMGRMCRKAVHLSATQPLSVPARHRAYLTLQSLAFKLLRESCGHTTSFLYSVQLYTRTYVGRCACMTAKAAVSL